MESLLLAEPLAAEPLPRVVVEAEPVVESGELLEQIESYVPAGEEAQDPPAEPSLFAAEEQAANLDAILADMAAEPDCTFQPVATLFQDFTVRCRMARMAGHGMDVTAFRRRFALAVAGADPRDPGWAQLIGIAGDLSDDLLAPFLIIARAAQLGEVCPDDSELSRVYGTSSPGRIRRLLEHFEKANLIVVRTDYGGRRSIGLPALGASTASV